MKINAKLLPMKLHYFFSFGGTAPLLPYLPVYINQNLHISYKGVGFIYTLLPFFGLIVKAASGALSDWLHIHRTVFLSSIVLCGASFFSMYFTPPMPYQPNNEPAHIQFDCSAPSSYLRHSLHGQKCWDGFKKNGTTTCELKCESDLITTREMCQLWNVPPSQCSENGLNFTSYSYLNKVVEDQIEMFLPVSNLTIMSSEVMNPICPHPIRSNCSVKCDHEKLMTYLGVPSKIFITKYSEIMAQYSFWIFLTLFSLAWSGLAICVVMSDTICFQLLGVDGSKYGRTRMFGSIGWGLFVILTGLLIDITSEEDSVQKNYASAFILCICIMSVDFLVATRLQVTETEVKDTLKLADVLRLFPEPKILLFLGCCYVVGISTGTLWTYQLMLVEQTVYAWDCHFDYIKLLQGLIVGVACFGGELPFFFFSEYFIKKLGHVHCMSLVVFVFGIRFILYAGVTNPWLFLPIELLNGFTFGIFYATMTSYASIIAPPGAQATLQGVVGATFEGLGVASGGMIGGALFASVGGAKAFLYVGIFNLGVALLHVATQAILDKFRPPIGSPSFGGYLPPSESLSPVHQSENSDARDTD